MSRWFRLYADAMRNPKIARLSDKDFRLWVRLLAVASESDGLLPCLDDLKHLLNVRLDHLSTSVERLISGGLIDPLEHGYEPHHWQKFQYKSDTSTERVHKHREKRNVSVTPPDTEADTETEVTIAKAIVAKRKAKLPVDFKWEVSPGSITAGIMAQWSPDDHSEQLEKFIDHHTVNATLSMDWQASWRTWVKNWRKFNGQRITNGRTHRRADDIDEAAVRLGFT